MAGGGGVFSRCWEQCSPARIDYSDSLLADKYTRHVSIRVMEHAAELDLIAYEDPVFYDRLERARVQATDRLAMIQMLGRLVQQVDHYDHAVGLDHVFLAVADVAADRRSASAFLGESHFAFLGMPRTSGRRPCAGNWTTCGVWAEAKKRPRN